MTSCDNCTHPDHDPASCHNRRVPMIHRTCTCACDRVAVNPAPYWTRQMETQ
jgi:hypothetical protein